MSSRLHNKFHRHNHHTNSTNDPRYPDASYDPIASYTSPFQGPFVVQNPGQIAPTTQSTTNVAIDVGGDIVAIGNMRISGQYFGDGSQLALGNNTSLIATVTGTPFVYGASNPVTSITSSISGTGNGATAQYSTVAGGSANRINGSGSFSFIAAGSSNQINVPNTFILGTNINASLPNYTYVNNLSSLGTIYATTIGASSVNAIHIGDGSLLNLSNNPLSATTTTLVNTVSANLVTLTNTTSGILVTLTNATSSNLVTITNTVSTNLVTLVNTVSTNLNAPITGLQSLSGNWQNVYSLVNTTTATTFNVKNLSATGFVNTVSANLGTTGSIATLNVSPLTITGAANGSVFKQIQNTVAGVSASTDISLYNNDGINYLDLGITSTNYNGNTYSPVFNVVKAGDSYVYATSGNLVQGAADVNGNQTFFTGGTLSGNERMRITNTGNVGIGTTVPNNKLTVVGDISATGTLTTNSVNVSGSVNSTGIITATTLSAASVYSNGVLLINSSAQSSYYYSSNNATNNIGTAYGNVFDTTSVLPGGTSTDILISSGVYEIIYDVNIITGSTQTLTFALSSGTSGLSFTAAVNYIYTAGVGKAATITTTNTNGLFYSTATGSSNKVELQPTQASIAGTTANGIGNNMYIRAIVSAFSGVTPITLLLKNSSSTSTTAFGSYRKVTRIY